MAISIGESMDTLEDYYEPYLIQTGILQRTSRGRIVTMKAYEHLGLEGKPHSADERLLFNLPDELIAQYPSEKRGNDKLLVLDKDKDIEHSVSHYSMQDLISLIDSNTLMVFNNSRVRRSRVFAQKKGSEKPAEFLFITELQPSSEDCVWKVMVKNAKKHRPDSVYTFSDGSEAVLIDNESDHGTEFRTLRFNQKISESWFETNGHIPLPPYIKRADNKDDSERYQNVYAKETGSAACPTAGLHFTESMLDALEKKGIDTAYVTLHVGLGTLFAG